MFVGDIERIITIDTRVAPIELLCYCPGCMALIIISEGYIFMRYLGGIYLYEIFGRDIFV